MKEVQIKLITKDKIKETQDFIKHNPEQFLNLYSKYPDLFLGFYLDDILVGACYGCPFSEEIPKEKDKIILKHISVLPEHRRKGYATKLIQLFEEQTKKRKFFNITLGSADERSDSFYLKNKYFPTKYMIRGEKEKIPKDYKNLYKLSNKRIVGDMLFLYVNCDKCVPSLKEKFRNIFKVDDVKFIFEKKI
jgi:GNAT superfamily N-acetyltransferase